MNNTSHNVSTHGGVDKVDPNVSVPETWAEKSYRNIQDSKSTYAYISTCTKSFDNCILDTTPAINIVNERNYITV